MGWPLSILVAIVSAVLGMAAGGCVAGLAARWNRFSSFEGKSGFAIVGAALLGGVAGLVVGLIVARVVAAGEAPGFLKALGAACGSILGIALVVMLLCRLGADIAPTLDGQELHLEIELRWPSGDAGVMPDARLASVSICVPGGNRVSTRSWRPELARLEDGRMVIPATMPLTTRSSEKVLFIRFSVDHDVRFALPLRSRPKASDCEWSAWIEGRGNGGAPGCPNGSMFTLRYRVQPERPSPEPSDPAAIRAAEFRALTADAPLGRWLPFLFESPDVERTSAVIRCINLRPGELAALIRAPEGREREYGLRAAPYLEHPTPEVVEAMLAVGREISEGIRRTDGLIADEFCLRESASDVESRFRDWRDAWRSLARGIGADLGPTMQEIRDLAAERSGISVMRDIEQDAREALAALEQSPAGKRP